MQKGLFIFLLTLIITVQCNVLPQFVVNALERALNCVYDDCKDFNVDGVFGVALAEGK